MPGEIKVPEMHVSEKFEHLLDTYGHSDGRKWSGAELAKATGGVVPCSYVTNLLKDRIESPGYGKTRAVAEAVDFPLALWFGEDLSEGSHAGPDGDLTAALRDDLVRAIPRGRARLPGRDKEMVLGIARQFGNSIEVSDNQDRKVTDGVEDGRSDTHEP